MSDVTKSFSIEYDSNADQVAKKVGLLGRTIDDLGRSGDISERGMNKLSRGILSVESAMGSATGRVTRYSAAFGQLRKEAAAAQEAMQKAAQARVVGGKTDPLSYSANRMSLGDAQKNIAVDKASSLSLVSASRERVALEDRLNDAKRQGASYDQRMVNLGRDRADVARENLAAAQKELATAQKVQSRVSSGSGAGAVPFTVTEQVQAEENLAAAKKKVYEATRDVTAITKDSSEGYVTLRYALYDVSRTAFTTSAAITGIGVITAKTFADVESGFSAVERTSGLYGDAVAPLREELLALSRVLPVSTQEIQNFAARGAQLGIAEDSIAGFTETIAKFVATSPEVDVNSVAEAFGRISNLTGEDDFLAIASAIAQVGVNSAATDQQIIKTTQEFARAAASTSLTADEIIGLSAAFASLGVQPEAARGIANQFFTQLNKGAAGLNDSMSIAARMMGKTEKEAAKLFKTDTASFFQNFVTGLSQTEDVTLALNEMGLNGARLSPAFQALAKDARDNAAGQSVLALALKDSNQGMRERTELDRQFAPIADDLNSKAIEIANAFRELAYAAGLELAPTLKWVFDRVKELITGFTDFVNTPAGASIVRMAGFVAVLGAALSGLVGAITLAGASSLAFRFALQQVASSGAAKGLLGLAGAFKGVGGAAAGSAGGVRLFSRALKTLGRVTIVGAILFAVSELVFNTGESLQWLGNAFIWLADTAVSAMSRVLGTIGIAAAKELKSFGHSIKAWGKTFPKAADEVGGASGAVDEFNKILGEIEDQQPDLSPTVDGMGDVGKAAEEATEKVRTAVDYASDLSSIWKRAFDIRFSGQQTMDAVRQSLQDFRDAAAESAKRVRDLKDSIRSLSADMGALKSDISILEYYLKIAREYGDTKRATALEAELAKKRAELAEKTSDLADKNKDLKKEQESQNKTLVGNSQAARNNRKAILNLVTQYQEQVNKLAESGASQADVAKKAEVLRQKFLDQATALGFNRDELATYAASLTDLSSVIATTPYGVNVDISGLGPAEAAIKEFAARANEALSQIGSAESLSGAGGIGGGIPTGISEQSEPVNLASQGLAITSRKGFMLALLPFKQEVKDRIYNDLLSGKMTIEQAAKELGFANTKEFLRVVRDTLPPGLKNDVRYAGTLAEIDAERAGKGLGTKVGTGVNSGTGSNLNLSSPVNQQIAMAGINAVGPASTIGRIISDGIRGGMSWGLDLILGADSKARKIIRAATGFQTGGYTGQGGVSEVAGVVHRGEYVIPKAQVNQTTGLPYADALGRLMSGAPSRTVTPAVSSGQTGSSIVSLSAGTIQAIAQATGKAIYLDGRMIADASAKVYSQQNTVGAY